MEAEATSSHDANHPRHPTLYEALGEASTPSTAWPSMRNCCLRELGRMDYASALELQRRLVASASRGWSRSTAAGRAPARGHARPQRASRKPACQRRDPGARRRGIPSHDRGAISPITARQLWAIRFSTARMEARRRAYVRAIEEVIIATLADFGIAPAVSPNSRRVVVSARSPPSACTFPVG